jgi:hypothetical protein
MHAARNNGAVRNFRQGTSEQVIPAKAGIQEVHEFSGFRLSPE